jgi:Flp pilus assembly protein TadG
MALSFLTVLTVLFWTMEFCSMLYTYTVLSDAAKEGVRYAVVNGSDYSASTCPHNVTYTRVQRYVQLSFHNTSGISICVSYPDGAPGPTNPLARVDVTIAYRYVPYLNIRGWQSPTISASAAGRIVY